MITRRAPNKKYSTNKSSLANDAIFIVGAQRRKLMLYWQL